MAVTGVVAARGGRTDTCLILIPIPAVAVGTMVGAGDAATGRGIPMGTGERGGQGPTVVLTNPVGAVSTLMGGEGGEGLIGPFHAAIHSSR